MNRDRARGGRAWWLLTSVTHTSGWMLTHWLFQILIYKILSVWAWGTWSKIAHFCHQAHQTQHSLGWFRFMLSLLQLNQLICRPTFSHTLPLGCKGNYIEENISFLSDPVISSTNPTRFFFVCASESWGGGMPLFVSVFC